MNAAWTTRLDRDTDPSSVEWLLAADRSPIAADFRRTRTCLFKRRGDLSTRCAKTRN